MKTVMIAGLAHTEAPYPDLVRTQLKTWDTVQVEGVDTMFYFDREWKENLPHTMAVDMDRGFFVQGKRGLLAYEWLLKNKAWDYMARINASCYVRKQLLLDQVQTLPDSGVFRGVANADFMWGGGHYIISRDVVQAIVDHQDLWDHGVMEDVAMSRVVKALGIPWDLNGHACSINQKKDGSWCCLFYHENSGGGFDMEHWWDIVKAPNQYFIRVKQDRKRHLDIEIMQELFKHGV